MVGGVETRLGNNLPERLITNRRDTTNTEKGEEQTQQ